MYSDDSSAWPETARPAPAAKAPWSGGGGRWTIWPMRIVLWAALLIVIYRGVTAIALNETPSSTSATSGAATATTQYPTTLAEAFVMQFGRVYFNVSPASAAQRQQQLGQFLLPSVLNGQQSQEFGFNGSATITLQSEDVAGIDVRGPQSAVVTLLVTVNNRLMEFGVPVFSGSGGIVISGLPALLPAPPLAIPPQSRPAPGNTQAESELRQQLPQFFQAYASGNGAQLARYLAPGASVSGLGGEVTFGSIASLYVPATEGTRDVTATVNWLLPGQQGASFSTTYAMSVVEQPRGKWYVEDIQASTQPVGAAS
ncbi:MAG TPA: conjugal transfer protein [Trebonia sp.]|nr:conjugal transfer protein [Trebonia sp.]